MAVDELDRRLVEMLAENGRRAFTDMAQVLGVSEATVRARVQRLSGDKLLKIVALCNPLTLGHQSVRMLVSVRDHTPRAVASALASLPALGQVALVSGSRDLYLEGTVRDVEQLGELMDEIRRTPGVADIDQVLMTRLYKDYSWSGLRNRSGERSVGSG